VNKEEIWPAKKDWNTIFWRVKVCNEEDWREMQCANLCFHSFVWKTFHFILPEKKESKKLIHQRMFNPKFKLIWEGWQNGIWAERGEGGGAGRRTGRAQEHEQKFQANSCETLNTQTLRQAHIHTFHTHWHLDIWESMRLASSLNNQQRTTTKKREKTKTNRIAYTQLNH
jgi:hypothetical protein